MATLRFVFLGWIGCVAACQDGGGISTDAMPCDASMCGCLTNRGTIVLERRVAEDAPAPKGGVITDGTYVITGQIIFTGPGGMTGLSGNMVSGTNVSAGGQFIYKEQYNGFDTLYTGTYSTDGTMITLDGTCGFTGSAGYNVYDAITTRFTVYRNAASGGIEAKTFTKL
jgi:hypothetical protein